MLPLQVSAFAVTSLLSSLVVVSALSKIQTVGSKFFTEDGDQFYIKGIEQASASRDPALFLIRYCRHCVSIDT